MDNNALQAEALFLLTSLNDSIVDDAVDSFTDELRQSFSPEELRVDKTDSLEMSTPMTILHALQGKMPEVFSLDALEKLIADSRQIDEMARNAAKRAQSTVSAKRDGK